MKSLVFLIDTTGSMRSFINALSHNIIEVLDMCTIMGVDVGIMAYKDYDVLRGVRRGGSVRC